MTPSLVGAPPPDRILAGNLRDLRKPDAVIVDNDRLDEALSAELRSWERADR